MVSLYGSLGSVYGGTAGRDTTAGWSGTYTTYQVYTTTTASASTNWVGWNNYTYTVDTSTWRWADQSTPVTQTGVWLTAAAPRREQTAALDNGHYDRIWNNWIQTYWTQDVPPVDELPQWVNPAAERVIRLADEASVHAARYRAEERAKAELVAQDLLKILIGEAEAQVYKETGRLFVKAKSGCEYIIRKGAMVQQIKPNQVQDLCIHLAERNVLPETDNVVALKMMIEADEEEFLRIANKHSHYPRPKVIPAAACLKRAA